MSHPTESSPALDPIIITDSDIATIAACNSARDVSPYAVRTAPRGLELGALGKLVLSLFLGFGPVLLALGCATEGAGIVADSPLCGDDHVSVIVCDNVSDRCDLYCE